MDVTRLSCRFGRSVGKESKPGEGFLIIELDYHGLIKK
jgi:hypothetical protein